MGRIATKEEMGVSKNDAPKIRDWDDMRVFDAVAKTGSLRRAANWLRLQAPTISKRIEALEGALGIRLFERTPRGLVLTPLGRRAAIGADSMQMLMEETASSLHSAREVDGEVRVLMSDGPANRWFIPFFLGPFIQKNPRVAIRLCTSSDSRDTVVPAFDIQLQYAPIGQDGIKSVRIAKLHFLFFAATEYIARFGLPKSREELADHRYSDIVPTLQSEHGFWSTYSNVEKPGRALLVSNSGLVVANAVRCGALIGLLPSYLYLADSNLIPVLPSIHYELGIYLNFSAAAAERSEVRALLDFLRDVVFDKRKPWFADDYISPIPEWRDAMATSRERMNIQQSTNYKI
jgi:DNA-binding transcriptional LysR family regulator